MSDPILELESVTHRYGCELAVEDVSFGLEAGELVAILGPSGCGKTTLVQAVAGHVRPTAGRVRLRGEDVTDAPPETRQVSVVFQESTLYPHMTVGENVAYGLAAQGIDTDRREELLTRYLVLVDLEHKRERYPGELSGGQKRRVELARALAPQPDVLVLDEPLSALDRALREQLREEVARIQRETGVTTLFVTHDQEEAMALADRLVVMDDGGVAGIGPPRELYESPPTPFVASFLGRSNTLAATVLGRDPARIAAGGAELTLPGTTAPLPPDGDVVCHVRPTDCSLQPSADAEHGASLSGTVTRVTDLGRRYDVGVRIDHSNELVLEVESNPPEPGERCGVELPPDAVTVFENGGDDTNLGGGKPTSR